MEITFLNKNLEKLYKEGKQNRKYKLPQKLIDKYIERVDFIQAADAIWALISVKSYHFEKLEGYSNRYSIRLSRQYRLIFNVKWMNEERTIGKFEIDEISNHYER